MMNPSTNRRRLSPKTALLAILSAVCLVLPLGALRLPGQNIRVKFSGTIHDPSGAPVPSATIIMSREKPNAFEMTSSSREGNFNFSTLPAGEYQMRVLKPGFEDYRAPRVVLQPGRESSQKITLNMAVVMEETDVVAEGTPKALHAGPVGGEVQAPKLITRVQPVYPAGPKAAGFEGAVLLHAIIGMDGSPLSLRVMNNEVDPELARAAVEAVSKWRYSPTRLNSEPIEADTTITVNFKLVPQQD